MSRRKQKSVPYRPQMDMFKEIIVDNFAGGGGASTGIELATGRIVDIAVNHDPDAVLMHQTNHPYTEHYCESVWKVDPIIACNGRNVGLAWFSPDCRHFSKAIGKKPVKKNIRGLAWIVLRWAGTVRPRVIILENVEEFQTWGPVKRGRPVKSKAGQTFTKFVTQLRDLGYEVEWKELVAADYGTPTTRKRFFLIARCDGNPVVWPKPTHAPAGSKEVQNGTMKPWRAASEIIDWSLPCPSVFATKADIKNQYGLNAVRPLADNTMRRVIRGVEKYVIKSANPFIVQVNHAGDFRGQEVSAPLQTVTAKHGYGIVTPVCSPVLMANNENAVGTTPSQPIGTVTTGGHHMLLNASLTAASIIQYHSERSEHVRGQSVDKPVMTVDSSGRYAVVGASLVKYHGCGTGSDVTMPNPTILSKDHEAVSLAFLSKYYDGGYKGAGSDVTTPLHTTTAIDHNALSIANLTKYKGDNIGSAVTEPVMTAAAKGMHHGALLTIIVRASQGVDLQHWPKIRSLLNRYCGYTLAEDEVLLFYVDGSWRFIGDIGLRMLTPRELYSANGFPVDYIIEKDYKGNSYGKTKQVARCGNAVPPPFAIALLRANLPEWCDIEINTMREFEQTISA